MAKTQVNFRASAHTSHQLDELVKKTGMNQTEVIAVAIDRMYQEETKMKTRTMNQTVSAFRDNYAAQCSMDDFAGMSAAEIAALILTVNPDEDQAAEMAAEVVKYLARDTEGD
jgi:capsular polysaccharide biosynthesis protein